MKKKPDTWIIHETREEFEEFWASSSPDEKVAYGRRFIAECQRLIDAGVDLDPQLIPRFVEGMENYRRAKIREREANENLRISRIEAKLARDAYFDMLNDDDLPHV